MLIHLMSLLKVTTIVNCSLPAGDISFKMQQFRIQNLNSMLANMILQSKFSVCRDRIETFAPTPKLIESLHSFSI